MDPLRTWLSHGRRRVLRIGEPDYPALLRRIPDPTRADIVSAISANICRCTGYGQIVEAIALAAKRLSGSNVPREAVPGEPA